VIRKAEKTAFFQFVDEMKNPVLDYPIDQTFGRIVGEVHIDHVPVDFTKDDFQRTSTEWISAMAYLRGETSLQPGLAGDTPNNSPVYRLYQGFRRVKTPGKTDMYMGYWDSASKKPKRISRDIERDYHQKFLERKPGYYDDTEWWKLVEQADRPPLESIVECPDCSLQNLESAEVCFSCGHIFSGKTCLNPACCTTIQASAVSCPHCGLSQVPEVQEPWICEVCRTKNAAGIDACARCGFPKGAASTVSRDYLLNSSNKSDDLSYPDCSILLPDNTRSAPVDVDVYVTRGPIVPNRSREHLPLVVLKSDRIEIFVDSAHPMFETYGTHPEQLVAGEVAQYIFETHRQLAGGQYSGQFSVSSIEWQVLISRWAEVLEDSSEKVKKDISSFLGHIKERLPEIFGSDAADYYTEMSDTQKKSMFENLLSDGIGIDKLQHIVEVGDFLTHVDDRTIADLLKKFPEKFFDGHIWDVPYIKDIPEIFAETAQERAISVYTNMLEDIINFSEQSRPSIALTHRSRLSLDYLQEKAVVG